MDPHQNLPSKELLKAHEEVASNVYIVVNPSFLVWALYDFNAYGVIRDVSKD